MSDVERPSRRELTLPAALAISLSLTCLLASSATLFVQVFPRLGRNLPLLGVIEVVIYVGASVLVAALYNPEPRPRALSLVPAPAPLVVIGAGLGFLAHLPAGYVAMLIERRFPTDREVLAQRLQDLTPSSSWHALVIFAVVAIAAPFAEELFFRGALFGALERRRGPTAVMSVTAIAFTLAHFEPRLWAPLFVVAALLSHLRASSPSLWPCLALHAAFNGTTLALVFSGHGAQAETPDVPLLAGLVGTALTVGGALLFGRLSRVLSSPPEQS